MSGRCPDINTCRDRVELDKLLMICLEDYKRCWKHRDKRTPKEWLIDKDKKKD